MCLSSLPLPLQVFVTSKDGTQVPMFIIHRRGLQLDGTNPTMLYGCGERLLGALKLTYVREIVSETRCHSRAATEALTFPWSLGSRCLASAGCLPTTACMQVGGGMGVGHLGWMWGG